jgi:hypothetical protein
VLFGSWRAEQHWMPQPGQPQAPPHAQAKAD